MPEEPASGGFPQETDWLTFRGSAIHGSGAFARRHIPAGTAVIEYVGARITKSEALARCQADNSFIFTLDDTWDLDGSVEWNLARFINHSCDPNCEAELRDGRIWINALRDIAPGEEVTFNYGYDLVDYREHPCLCGSSNCVGYMVAPEFFEHVRQQREYTETEPRPGS